MKRIVILTFAMMLLLTACGESDALQKAEVIPVNTDQNDPGYVPGEDYQQNWNDWGSNIGQLSAASEEGYYYYDRFGDGLLHFHDFASGQTVVLCNRPDCDHKSVDCNATVSGMGMFVQYLQFYDGNLYIIGSTNGLVQDVSVWRISADSTVRGEVGTMLTIPNGGSFHCIIHRGYHAMIAKLVFGGLECYKVIVMQKGILVLAVLCFLFVQSYPVRQITYVGEAQFLRGFYEEFSGQGITLELTAYIEALQEKLDSVEAEFLGSQQAFESGEIDTTQYLAASQKYAAFDVQRKALSTIREKIAWVESQNAQGFDAVILDSSGYDRLLEQSDADQIMVLIALCGCIALSALLFPMEQKPGLRPMIRSTRKGRQVLAAKKLTFGLVFSAVVFILYALIRAVSIGLTHGFEALTAPAHSLMQFGQSTWNPPIWVTLAGWLLSQWLVFGLVSVLVCLLTQKFAIVGSMMIGVLLCMGTAVLSLFGMGLPTIWNLLNNVTRWLCCGDYLWLMLVTVTLIIGWIITVRLWSGNGRRKP